MLSKSSLLMAMLGLGLVMGSLPKLKLPTTPKIHRLEQQSELLSAQNPATTQKCFAYYGPLLNDVSTTYEINYSRCTSNYENSSKVIYCTHNSTLFGIASDGEAGCNTFADCSTIVDYVQAFECFARVGAQESKTMYETSAIATRTAASIQGSLVQVETTRDICVTDAERYFVEATTNTYERLNGCLNGDGLVDIPDTTI